MKPVQSRRRRSKFGISPPSSFLFAKDSSQCCTIGLIASNPLLSPAALTNTECIFFRLYQVGLNPKIERLYPSVKFPVPRGTPVISDLIKWNHNQSFIVPRFSPRTSQYSREFKLDKDDAYLLDHGVDGRTLFPGA
ncbi:hypothetical protein AVEN_257441-1 [Araneus ventricosus]|uniref:Uncharacterized protein n=1 Tax=Araneus ventricosus TaxID=182803 RepID=A0A4Y2FG89_ARAVE|nr:hypothetical protein AVEN_257441-1 [Araneus ventricosus]